MSTSTEDPFVAPAGDLFTEPPTDAVPEQGEEPRPSAEIEVVPPSQPAGFLTFRPHQDHFTPAQSEALRGIVNFDPLRTPSSHPHIKVFMHVCQMRALDPWAREAYLIRRGSGNYESFTIQVGIDGYRKMAQRTGRFIRRVGIYWSGGDDDDNVVDSPWWRFDPDEGAYDRVWVKVWLRDEPPKAARVVIEHYDDNDNVVRTEGLALWKFYAPYNPKWEGRGDSRRKVRDADGNDVLELSEMWAKGGPHMLGKCAEAQALRAAFPAAMSGIYTHEEMHRADAEEQQRLQEDRDLERQAKYQQAVQGRKARPEGQTVTVVRGDVVQSSSDREAPGEAPAGPLLGVGEQAEALREDIIDAHLIEDDPEVQEPPRVDPERVVKDTLAAQFSADDVPDPDQDDILRGEVDAVARFYGVPTEVIVRRTAQAVGVPYAQWSLSQLHEYAVHMRENVIGTMREKNIGRADVYALVPPGGIVPDVTVVGLEPPRPE
jgi:phage recombination protein Bet